VAAPGAGNGDAPASSFVIAVIGATVPDAGSPPTGAAEGETVTPVPTTDPGPAPERTAEPDSTSTPAGTGSIAVEVLNCPAGMDPDALDPAACVPAGDDFDLTLSGEALETTLTLADAVALDGGYAWQDLPVGEYVLAQAVLPIGYTDYVAVVPAGVTGNPASGYRIALDADALDVRLRIFNLRLE